MSSDNTIVECVFDIQFESNSVAESYIATIAKVDGFEQITKLPLHQVPDSIRKNDPNLKMQPLYEITSLSNTDYKVMLGDNVIGIAMKNSYTSWTNSFFPQLKKLFSEIFKTNKINKISRMGLRYVDFLENENIFETGKIKVDIIDNSTKKMFLRIEDSLEGIQYNKVMANNVKYQSLDNEGSIIDIVTSIENYSLEANKYDDVFQQIDMLHSINKEKFKEVISDEYVTKYGI